MKRDERTDRLLITEPNIGRPTGMSALAEAAGVELLATMYRDTLGLPLPEQRTQSYRGVKWMHVRRDAQSAFHYWRVGELSLRDWYRSVRGKKTYADVSWSDPMPFLADVWREIGLALDPGRRRVDLRK
jgi:predicted ATP-grasp superfamily ATP-dependent carboligase